VVAIPALDKAVVITSTNFSPRDMHEQTGEVLTDYLLGWGRGHNSPSQ